MQRKSGNINPPLAETMDDERAELLARVASLYYEDDLTQQEISQRLGYSRSLISRLLTEARREGIVDIQVHHPLARIEALERALAKRFDLRQVRVLNSKGAVYAHTLNRLGALAACLLEQIARPNSVIGLSWGTALYELVHAFRPAYRPGVKVVQLIGAASSRDHQVDGPGLVRALADKFDGQYYVLPAPWLVDDKDLRDALMNDRRLREVLDLAGQVDIALVGIGTVEPSLSSFLRAGYITLEQTRMLQASGVVGDVCGLHFGIAGNLMDLPLVGYVFGIEAARLRDIPLVMGVAGGQAKAPAILGALRARLVNALVTDDVAARLVLELAEGPGE